MGAAVVSIRSATVRFGSRTVLDRLTLDVAQGELLVLLGSSGSGKTTALRLMNALGAAEPPDAVEVLGRPTPDWDPVELRRRTGFLIQGGGLFPHLSVVENVRLAPRALGWGPARSLAAASDALARVGLDDGLYAHRSPDSLSGGERQRVALARALVCDPPLLLFDEPFSALDPITRRRLQDEVRQLVRALGKTAVLVTHDLVEAARMADRVALLHDGRIAHAGPPRAFLESPPEGFASEFVRASLP